MVDFRKGMKKDNKIGIIAIGTIEIVIGLVTLISLAEAKLFFGITKPLGVFLFVFVTSLISFMLGVGILRYRWWARKLLIFFSGYIILTKIFLLLGILKLSPAFETLISSNTKNIVSSIYHLFVILFFCNKQIRKDFE